MLLLFYEAIDDKLMSSNYLKDPPERCFCFKDSYY